MIGMGAYGPYWFNHQAHPSDAIKVFNDLKAKHCIFLHYGNFDLSDEPIF